MPKDEQEQTNRLNAIIREQLRIQNEVTKRLHDEMLQEACLMHWQLQLLAKSIIDKQLLKPLQDTIYKMIDNGQHILYQTNNSFLQDISIDRILKFRLEQINKSTSIQCNIEIKGCEIQLDDEVKAVIYRIAMEAIRNIIKHAAATQIDIVLTYCPKIFSMRITDNGIGFNMDKPVDKYYLGLQYLHERAEYINGTIDIQAKPGAGCTVTFSCLVTT